jgi:hypothetical protein
MAGATAAAKKAKLILDEMAAGTFKGMSGARGVGFARFCNSGAGQAVLNLRGDRGAPDHVVLKALKNAYKGLQQKQKRRYTMAAKGRTFLHDGPTQLTDEHIKACIADTSDITDVRPLRRRFLRIGEVDELSLTMAERFARPTFHKGLAPALLKMYRELMTPGLFPFAQAKMQEKRVTEDQHGEDAEHEDDSEMEHVGANGDAAAGGGEDQGEDDEHADQGVPPAEDQLAVLVLTDDDEPPTAQPVDACALAANVGRRVVATAGGGNCLFHALGAELDRLDIFADAPRAVRAALEADGPGAAARLWVARQAEVGGYDGGMAAAYAVWGVDRIGRPESAPAPARDGTNYSAFIRQEGVWGNQFDVALAAAAVGTRTRVIVLDPAAGRPRRHLPAWGRGAGLSAVPVQDVECMALAGAGIMECNCGPVTERDVVICRLANGTHFCACPPLAVEDAVHDEGANAESDAENDYSQCSFPTPPPLLFGQART